MAGKRRGNFALPQYVRPSVHGSVASRVPQDVYFAIQQETKGDASFPLSLTPINYLCQDSNKSFFGHEGLPKCQTNTEENTGCLA